MEGLIDLKNFEIRYIGTGKKFFGFAVLCLLRVFPAEREA